MEKSSHLLPVPVCNLMKCFLLLLLISCFTPSALSASRRPISEDEIRHKKNACYADIESGLWGWKCKSSITEKENCALRCLSSACYQLIYESDPLEEGERDHSRNHEYKYCLHKMTFSNSNQNCNLRINKLMTLFLGRFVIALFLVNSVLNIIS